MGPPGPPGGPSGPQGPAGAGINFDPGKIIAFSAAFSQPAWLEKGENFSLSGGFGFAGTGETAYGVTGIMRLGPHVAGFAGGAMDTQGGRLWGGKVGARIGW
jgi:hypothetical protein